MKLKIKFAFVELFNGGGIMVYGVVGFDGCLYLNKIEGTLDSAKYVKLLKEEVMPLLHSKFGT